MSQFVINRYKKIPNAAKNPNLVINGFTEIKDKNVQFSHIPKMIFRKMET